MNQNKNRNTINDSKTVNKINQTKAISTDSNYQINLENISLTHSKVVGKIKNDTKIKATTSILPIKNKSRNASVSPLRKENKNVKSKINHIIRNTN